MKPLSEYSQLIGMNFYVAEPAASREAEGREEESRRKEENEAGSDQREGGRVLQLWRWRPDRLL